MGDLGIGAGLGVLAFWGFIAATVLGGMWYGIREREAQHETLRRIIESGHPIDNALVDKLLSLTGGGNKYLARNLKVFGLVTLSVAPGLAVFGWIMAREFADVLLPIMLAVSALVGCIAIGLLVASYVVGRWYSEEDRAAPNLSEV